MKLAVLFLTRNSLVEPLGRSQIIPYMIGLAKEHTITICSCEANVGNEEIRNTKVLLNDFGIEWIYREFPKNSGVISFIKIAIFYALFCIVLVARKRFQLIHARSYPAAVVAWMCKKLFGIPYIFDMRGFWIDELCESQRIKKGGKINKLADAMERWLITTAAHTVVLADTAKIRLRDILPAKNFDIDTNVSVIPTCVTVSKLPKNREIYTKKMDLNPRVHATVGTVLSGWFDVELLRTWIKVVLANGSRQFHIVTKDDTEEVMAKVRIRDNRFKIYALESDDVIPKMRRFSSVALFYDKNCESRVGRCPTRFAECMVAGVPVLCSPAIGDLDRYLQGGDRKGLIVESQTQIDDSLIRDIETLQESYRFRERALELVDKEFSVDQGVRRYMNAYESVFKATT